MDDPISSEDGSRHHSAGKSRYSSSGDGLVASVEALQEQYRCKRSALGSILEVDSPSSIPSSSHRKRRRVMPSLTSKNLLTDAVATNGSSPEKVTNLLLNNHGSSRLVPSLKTTRAEQPGTSLTVASTTRIGKPEASSVTKSVRPHAAPKKILHVNAIQEDCDGLHLVRLTKQNHSSRSLPTSSSRISVQNSRSHQRRRAKLVIEFNDHDHASMNK